MIISTVLQWLALQQHLCIGYAIYKTTDGGFTWLTITPSLPDSPPSKLKMFNESIGVLVGPTGFFGNSPFVYKTTDGGITWNSMNFTFSGAANCTI